jgi:hypothetical protein
LAIADRRWDTFHNGNFIPRLLRQKMEMKLNYAERAESFAIPAVVA